MTIESFLKDWYDDRPTLLVHTSGSTGTPKPMWVEKRRMLNSARITCDFLGLAEGDTALLCMPLDYIAGKMVVVRSIERKMSLVAVKPSGHPLATTSMADAQVVRTIGNGTTGGTASATAARTASEQTSGYDGTLAFAAMVPLQVYNSLQNDEERTRLRSVRQLIIGGGAVDEELAEALKDFPNAVWSTYGMTETLSHIALRRLSGATASDWYVPFEGVGVSLSADGCLVIDAPLVCDHRLTTNDRAELRTAADGRKQFHILGRKDNVIDSGGIKVQIEEVEKALKPHLSSPYYITRRKERKFGEVVVLLTESDNLDAVREVCECVLPKFWQPRVYKHTDRLPQTETGKPARALAEQMAANEKGDEIIKK